MKKNVCIFGGILLLVVGCSVDGASNKENIKINNQTCPVTGNHVNDKDTYIYKGKEYNLCSDACKRSLSEEPEKYLQD